MRRWTRRGVVRLWAASSLWLAGCPNQELAPLNPCTVSGVTDKVSQQGVDKVDLLFVVDNSGSMGDKQRNVMVQLERLVQVLTSGDYQAGQPEKAGYGTQDFTPVASLHLGVVSVNLGIDGVVVPGANCDGAGDDGHLLSSTLQAQQGVYKKDRETGAVVATLIEPDPSCAPVHAPRYQEFVAPSDPSKIQAASTQLAHDFRCTATLGIDGCGFEQPLEAMWKALAPSTESDFVGLDHFGQGAPRGFNAGFLRDDAVLAVIVLTDEQDGSITDAGKELFDPNSLRFKKEDINVRVGLHADDPSLVFPPERYINGLKRLKPDHPDRVIFAGITGIPLDMDGRSPAELLADPRMKWVAKADGSGSEDVCSGANGRADPATRITKVAAGFGDNGLVRCICSDDYGPALDVIIERISKQLTGACLPRKLTPDASGVVKCNVVEILAPGDTSCDQARGRVYLEQRPVGNDLRTVCNVNQVAIQNGVPAAAPAPITPQNALQGWYYDTLSADLKKSCPAGSQQRIAFTHGAELASGATASFECFQSVTPSNQQAVGRDAVGAPCQADTECAAKNDAHYKLFCASHACQIQCTQDAQCPEGWGCAPGAGIPAYCADPTCPFTNDATQNSSTPASP